MAPATLTINSRNYGSWSMRGWLLCRMAGLDFVEEVLPAGDPATRAELLLLSPSFLVPRLEHAGVTVWDALAIAEYLQERFPHAGLLPDEPVARAHCRSISCEVHGGFVNLRSALPMNMTARHPGFPVFSGARPTSSGSPRSGATAWASRAARSCSAAARRWRTRCSRRSAHGSSPTTSPSTPRVPPTATRCSRCRTSPSGRSAPPLEPQELVELEAEF